MSGQKCLLLLSNSGQFVIRTVDGLAFKITETPIEDSLQLCRKGCQIVPERKLCVIKYKPLK